MSSFSIKTRMAAWYTILLFIIVNMVFAAVYISVRMFLTRQNEDTVKKTAERIAGNVRQGDSGLYIDLSQAEELEINGMLYALYDNDGVWQDGDNYLFMQEVEHEGEEDMHWFHHEHEHWFVYDAPAVVAEETVGRVKVLLSAKAQSAIIARIRNIWQSSLLPALILACIGGVLTARSAMKPLMNITNAAQGIGKGDFSKRIDAVKSNDEIGRLANTFNEMADSLEQSFEREKQFTSDASHEMRTPIAIITALAEDAKDEDSIETYRETIEGILLRARQMQKIISQLLILSRSGDQCSSMQFEPLDLFSVIQTITGEAEKMAAGRDIAIYCRLEENITIRADLLFFTIMMLNLINNAVKYGREGGLIEITTAKNLKDKMAVITISDNGIGISEKHLPHIFERFYRADESRSEQSSGLGLSLVEMIVKLHNGTIAVKSALNEGTAFTVNLPLSGDF